jgi:hypothetical protein
MSIHQCGCDAPFRRLERPWWLRMIPWSRLYKCSECTASWVLLRFDSSR